MNLRMSVTYPATDGSMPENVEIEWTDIDPAQQGGALVALDRLLTAPRFARDFDVSADLAMPTGLTAVADFRDPNDYCQRSLCGHAYGFHSGNTAGGRCSRCDNPQKCASFVGKAGQ